MEFYNKINNFLIKNIVFILLLMCAVICFSINKMCNNTNITTYDKFEATQFKSKTLYSNASDAVAMTRNYSINERKLVKKFSINIVVDNVDKKRNEIEDLLKDVNGYIDNFYSYEYDNNMAINFIIKVPTNNVSNFLNKIKTDVFVKNESYSSIDFTEQYSDNENRLKNLYTRRDKLRIMLNKQADKLTDVLAVDKELNNVQNEIEKLEKKNLKIQNDVDYSEINLTIEPKIIKDKNIIKWSFKKVCIDAINLLILTCQMLIHYFVVFVVFLPLIICFFIVSIILKKTYLYIKKCIKR